MSDFDDFVSSAFDEASGTFGTVSFTVDGISGTKVGVWDRSTKTEELQGGGFLPGDTPSIDAAKGQFATEPQLGRDVTVTGKGNYRIARVEDDGVTYRIVLEARV